MSCIMPNELVHMFSYIVTVWIMAVNFVRKGGTQSEGDSIAVEEDVKSAMTD